MPYYKSFKKRKYRRTVPNSDAQKQLGVMAYPHSKLTMAPKIPDGSAMQSIGMKFQNILAKTFTTNTHYVVLFPGLSGYCQIHADVAGSPQVTPGYGNSFWNEFGEFERATAGVITTTAFWNMKTIARWRTVGVGLRIRLTNNDDDNDGSWEAIRIPVNKDANKYHFAVDDTKSPPVCQTTLYPPLAQLEGVNWAQIPSYTSGLLKDIGSKYFQLKHVTATNDFKNVNQAVNLNFKAGDDGTAPAFKKVDASQAGVMAMELINNVVDDQLDVIVIRLNGVATKTKITMDAVNCLEYETQAKSTDSRFMTEAAYAPKQVEYLKEKLRRRLTYAAV